MEVSMREAQVMLGPVLFNWSPDRWRDFYLRIADEAPVETVYLGEAVCSKRTVLFAPHWETVARRLVAAGKTVVLSTLSEVILRQDRQQVESVCARQDALVEANDASALFYLRGRPHHVGPFVNVYNEQALSVLAQRGARNVCLPVELPASAIRVLGPAANSLGVTIEVQVFGRLPLALSARCYHARAHGRTKDSCQFVCENDPDGLDLSTLDGRSFLAVNGIQTLSYDYLNLINELADLQSFGVARFRLSPHTCDVVEVASVFRSALDRVISPDEAGARLDALGLPRFSNGFFRGKPGYTWNGRAP
jgi:collagenase-like PrtC family protease